MEKIVYIIGNYAAGDGRTEQQNVTRAVALGSLALMRGMVPIIPHLTIGCPALLLGRHGSVDADVLAREASYGGDALSGGLAKRLATVADDVWVLLRDNGGASTGTGIEYSFATNGADAGPFSMTWDQWRSEFAASDLLDLYDAASKTDATFPRWPEEL